MLCSSKFSFKNSENPNIALNGLLKSCAIIEKNLSFVLLLSRNSDSLFLRDCSAFLSSVKSTTAPLTPVGLLFFKIAFEYTKIGKVLPSFLNPVYSYGFFYF